jgi:hypothetical protein
MEFLDLFSQLSQSATSFGGGAVVPPRLARDFGVCPKETGVRHTRQDWVKRARTEPVAVLREFLKHPQSIHGVNGRMVQYVRLTKRQSNFTQQRF